jgi:SAM-dependent methyltransferase
MTGLSPDFEQRLEQILAYFNSKLVANGPTPGGVDWNSVESQTTRYRQILKVCDKDEKFSVIDYGCGYGGMIDYMSMNGYEFQYIGYDPLKSMIDMAQQLYRDRTDCSFTADLDELQPADYLVSSGIFNIKLDIPAVEWTEYCLSVLNRMDSLSTKGFSFNMLTNYSDPERMRPDLYYADPLFFFDYCKRKFARNVALLHDYIIYDFTILVRKALD